jgi:two-component system sensor kinase FixL
MMKMVQRGEGGQLGVGGPDVAEGDARTKTGEPAGAGCQGRTVSEARFSGVLDTAADGIVVIDEEGRILAFNKSCERLFGYAADEVIGQNLKVIMPASYAGAHDHYIRHYRRTGERRIIGIGREVAGMHRDGTVFPVELSVGEAVSSDGRQFIGILRDLRPRKAVEQRLSQLQAQIVHMTRLSAMDEMGAAMAHELNQPLTALMLYLQAATRPMKTSDDPICRKVVPIIEKALHEAERAAGIIQRMRQMVEKREPERSHVDLRRVVDEAVDLTDFVAQGSTVSIIRDYGNVSPMVDVDPIQIQQILLNLLKNAVEVARDSHERWVRIGIESHTGHVDVVVSDSGPGLSDEAAQNLFRTFSTTKKSGMGLGLAISRSIAQNHGGDLTVRPGSAGHGATFVLSLPRGESSGEAGTGRLDA